MMEFLYFPDDKTAYLVPVITLVLFFLGALLAMWLISRASKKELAKQEEKYAMLKTEHEKKEPETRGS
ncbi:hypothetical protein [Bacillus marinisedimentorum]|uniref:hypothetical protein n=1 Tax=Bacillus marinisedimentorum TaxID=1821260 RepID=UPI00087332F4|nr:hypothetical protein [Bacillus marinisedimentorum]